MTPACSKCGGRMDEGFLVDHTYGGIARPEWARGTPQRSLWTGVKMKGVERLPVRTLRCRRCGFLKSYARESQPR